MLTFHWFTADLCLVVVCFSAVADDVKNSCVFLSVKHSRWTAAHREPKPPTPTADQITDFSKFSHIKGKFQLFSAHHSVAMQEVNLWFTMHCLFLIPSTPISQNAFPQPPDKNFVHSSLCFRCRWREQWWQTAKQKQEREWKFFSSGWEKCHISFGNIVWLSVKTKACTETTTPLTYCMCLHNCWILFSLEINPLSSILRDWRSKF